MPASIELCTGQFYLLPDGKSMRYALFEPPQSPRGTMLVALGRRDFIEKKYAEIGRECAERCFRLIVFEWRGHGLSGRFWSDTRRQRDHIADYKTYLDDLDLFYRDVVCFHKTGPLIVFGHSMGGHLLLRWLAERPRTNIHAAILIAPMLALGPRWAHVMAQGMSYVALKFGRLESYGPWQHDYDWRDRVFTSNVLTHDRARFTLMPDYFRTFPDLTVGGVTWGWFAAALQSMRLVRQKLYLQQMRLRTLVLTGSEDKVTPPRELARYLVGPPNLKNFIIAGARHELMNELEIYRAQAWQYIDKFLEEIIKS